MFSLFTLIKMKVLPNGLIIVDNLEACCEIKYFLPVGGLTLVLFNEASIAFLRTCKSQGNFSFFYLRADLDKWNKKH